MQTRFLNKERRSAESGVYMGILNDVITILSESNQEAMKQAKSIEVLEGMLNRGEYGGRLADTKREEIKALKRSIEQIKVDAQAAVHERTDEALKKAKAKDELRPEDMTDDCKLLSCGVKLNANDLLTIAERNRHNNTMIQLVIKYAKDNGIDVPGLVYEGSRAEVEGLTMLADISDRYVRQWLGNPKYGEKILGQYFEGLTEV